jgi:hypothetical protein
LYDRSLKKNLGAVNVLDQALVDSYSGVFNPYDGSSNKMDLYIGLNAEDEKTNALMGSVRQIQIFALYLDSI